METLFLGTLPSEGLPGNVLQRRQPVFHRPFSNDRFPVKTLIALK
jgi:hypothetical protein